jgi:hypothetical protein
MKQDSALFLSGIESGKGSKLFPLIYFWHIGLQNLQKTELLNCGKFPIEITLFDFILSYMLSIK